jgi:hypothetical protein
MDRWRFMQTMSACGLPVIGYPAEELKDDVVMLESLWPFAATVAREM